MNWIDLFTRKEYSEIVIDSLRHCQRKKGLIIHAWNIMPGHLHMIASSRGIMQLSDIYRDFKKFTAEEIVKCMKEINESRREWILKQFTDIGVP